MEENSETREFFVMYLTRGSLEQFSTTQPSGERTVLQKKYFNHCNWRKFPVKHNSFKRICFKKQLEGQVFSPVTNTFLKTEFWLQILAGISLKFKM